MDYSGLVGKRFHLYIFDLDGTLVDSLEDLALSVNWILGEYGYSPSTGRGMVSASPPPAQPPERFRPTPKSTKPSSVTARITTRTAPSILGSIPA